MKKMLAIPVALFCLGCSGPALKSIERGEIKGEVNGFYSLPMGMVKVDVIRTTTYKMLGPEVNDKSTKIDGNSKRKQRSTETVNVKQIVVEKIADERIPDPSNINKKESSTDETTTTIEKQYEVIEEERVKLNESYKIRIGPVEMFPDPSHQYVIQYTPKSSSSDEIEIEFTENSFLKKIKSKTKDETADIVLKLAEIYFLNKKLSKIKDIQDEHPADTGLIETETILSTYIDPSNQNQIKNINEQFKLLNINQILHVEVPDSNLIATNLTYKETWLKGKTKNTGKNYSTGIFIRPVRPFELIITEELPDKKSITRQSQVILLPNGSEPINLDIKRAMFVEKVKEIDFNNGMVTRVSVKKPSQTNAFFSIPVNILKSLVAIPAELIQLKIDLTNKKKDLTEAQKAELEALKALLEAQAALENNKTPTNPLGDGNDKN